MIASNQLSKDEPCKIITGLEPSSKIISSKLTFIHEDDTHMDQCRNRSTSFAEAAAAA